MPAQANRTLSRLTALMEQERLTNRTSGMEVGAPLGALAPLTNGKPGKYMACSVAFSMKGGPVSVATVLESVRCTGFDQVTVPPEMVHRKVVEDMGTLGSFCVEGLMPEMLSSNIYSEICSGGVVQLVLAPVGRSWSHLIVSNATMNRKPFSYGRNLICLSGLSAFVGLGVPGPAPSFHLSQFI